MTRGEVVTFDTDGGIPIMTVTGDLDLVAVNEIDPLRWNRFANGEPVIVDLTHVTFVDSSGIGLFVQLAKRARSVRLRNAPKRTRRLLEIAGIEHLFSYNGRSALGRPAASTSPL